MRSPAGVLRGALVIAVLVVVVFMAWVTLKIGGSAVEQAVDDAMTAVAAVAAAVACFWAAASHQTGLRRFWLLLGAAMVAWAFGEIVWGVYEVVLSRTVPDISLADVGYLGAVPLAAAALLMYPSESTGGAPRVRALLDGLIVAGSVLLVSWVLVLASVVHSSDASAFATTVQLAYPLGDAMIISLVVIALTRTHPDARRALGWVLVGLSAMAIADTAFVYLTAVNGYKTGDLFDTGWLVAYLAIALGALHAVCGPRGVRPEPVEASGNLQRTMLIYVPCVAALALAGVKIVQGGVIDRVLWMTVLGTVAMVMARQVLAVAENAALTSSVEAKVIARTDELRHQSLHDALTGLPNRSLIMDRIEQLLARSRRTETQGAALYLDLDGFKTVNDALGHAQGDRLLQAVAARLTTGLRDADTLGRMGGDEFVVLLDGDSVLTSAESIAQRLVDLVHQPFQIDGVALAITASVGVATGDRASAGDLLRDADVALYEAKASGKDRYACYQPEMHDVMHDQLGIELDLRFAIERDELRLVYQPIYRLATMEMVGVEALVRWHHTTRGVIGPNHFIPMLEKSGGIIAVGRWALTEACRQAQVWHDQGATLGVAVNVSGRQLDNDSIIDDVARALESSGLEAKSLTIEVTETALMRNTDATARRLQQLKSIGVRIAIDDFGTGYSSLAYLEKFPVDCLKIDRAFIIAIDRSSESRALLHTLVQVGKALGLTVLAEGIETRDQADYLRAEQCDLVQGFHFARPLDAQTLATTLLDDPAVRNRVATVHQGG